MLYMEATLQMDNVKNTVVHICVNTNSGFFQYMPLHCLNFIEVKFIATVNMIILMKKGGVFA
jgi:hypothetical protein